MPAANLPPSGESDELLVRRVVRCLHQGHYLFHRNLNVDVVEGVVVVFGKLNSFYLRQRAVECIKHIPGVAQVDDLIEVDDCPDSAELLQFMPHAKSTS